MGNTVDADKILNLLNNLSYEEARKALEFALYVLKHKAKLTL